MTKRQPKGTPVGGQYAPDRKPSGGDLTVDEAVTSAHKWGRLYARRYGVDADDVVQEALLTYSSVVRAPDKPVTEAAINSAAKYAAIAAMQGRTNHRDDAALREYRDECAQEMNRLGRMLTSIEEDKIAADIRKRATKNPPSHSFHRRVKEFQFSTVPSDEQHRSYDSFIAEHVEDVVSRDTVVVVSDEFEPDSMGEKAMSLAAHDPARARLMAWDAVALPTSPRPVEDSLSKRRATELRAEIRSQGGATKCATLYLKGMLDNERLFEPFGESLDEDGKDKVCEVLTRHPEYGDSLWTVALSIAERR